MSGCVRHPLFAARLALKRGRGFAWALATAVLVLGAGGCTHSRLAPLNPADGALQGWARGGDPVPIAAPWLAQFDASALHALVAAALEKNYALQQSRARVQEAGYALTVAAAPLWPSLSTSLRATRRQLVAGELFTNSTRTRDDFVLAANLNWQVDIWGQLRASQRAARLGFASSLANYVAAEQDLVATLAQRYFAAVEAAQLEELLAARLESLEQSLGIVDSGYRSGLNGALDVYLAQNAVAQERGNLLAARQTALEARAALELLVAEYPAGQISTPTQLPTMTESLPVDLPTTLLTRRPDLQSSWLSMLAADAQLAVAHRARFPALALSASVSDTKTPFNELLSGGPLAWSLAGAITAPVFQGGRLLANERQALARRRQTEAAYLQSVFAAFAEVENGLSQEQALKARLQAAEQARSNAEAALELAFEQYRAGLVSFTTVLESQRRAFDAQTTEVRLRGQRLQNRVALNRALGGDFDGAQDQRVSTLLATLGGRLARRTEVPDRAVPQQAGG